ncbi:putative manganese transporter, partial [Halobacterium sp. CBA1126]
MVSELADVFLVSIRDAYVQVSAFVAVTVLAFGLLQYYTRGALLERLEDSERLQPLAGALLGLTPGCGGAIVVMPLYLRGSVSFGTVAATLAATAGDSAFVILALAPEAALYAYGLAFAAAVLT